MHNTNVFISGASVAGPALAYWLGRYGFNPTVVEVAPALRGLVRWAHAVAGWDGFLIGGGCCLGAAAGVRPALPGCAGVADQAGSLMAGVYTTSVLDEDRPTGGGAGGRRRPGRRAARRRGS
jgi:hypothetical protein